MAGEEEKKTENRPIVRTFKSDASEYIKKKGLSSVDIVSAGIAGRKNDAGRGETYNEGEKSRTRSRAILFVILAAIAAAGMFAVIKYGGPDDTEGVLEEAKPFIIPDNVMETDLAKAPSVVGTNTQVNTFLYVPIYDGEGKTKRLVTSKDFLNALSPLPPSDVADSVGSSFMLSEFYFAKNSPILIFKVNSYNRVFSGMVSWEGYISKSLEKIFHLSPDLPRNAFKDEVIAGKDARVLNDKNGAVSLLYSFIDKDFLVVTTSEEGLKEVVRRFTFPQYRNM